LELGLAWLAIGNTAWLEIAKKRDKICPNSTPRNKPGAVSSSCLSADTDEKEIID